MHQRRASLIKLNSNWPTPQFSIKSERRVSMQIVDILAGLPALYISTQQQLRKGTLKPSSKSITIAITSVCSCSEREQNNDAAAARTRCPHRQDTRNTRHPRELRLLSAPEILPETLPLLTKVLQTAASLLGRNPAFTK
jgi:hypothetical protein